jgi:Matrixin
VPQQLYPQGSRPRILINWQSFTAQGINAAWQWPFTDAVVNAYTRWMNVAGVDLRPQLWGFTTNTTAGAGELLIQMDPWFGGGSARLASTFGQFNALTIIFHRRSGPNGTPWNFVPWNASPAEIDMQGVLMHELGHCLGLDHSASANDTMFQFYVYHSTRFGPFEGDVAVLKSIYAEFTQNRLRQLRSATGGASWSTIPNELTSFNHYNTRTNLSPGAVGIRASGLYIVGWSHPNRIPTWLRNDGDKFLTRLWFFFGGERSVQGPAYASDTDGGLLWAWVMNDDNATIRLVRSDNRGISWYLRNAPANARSCGTPGLACTRVGGQLTWILVWPHFDRADQANTGFLRASVSTNGGASWSPPTFLNTTTKALSGVAVAADDNNHVLVACAFANHLNINGLNDIVTFRCQVAGGKLQPTATIWTGERTRIQPALAWDAGHNRFVMAWREQNFATTLATMALTPGAANWTGKVMLLGSTSHVAPGLASLPEYNEAIMWYAYEGP